MELDENLELRLDIQELRLEVRIGFAPTPLLVVGFGEGVWVVDSFDAFTSGIPFFDLCG